MNKINKFEHLCLSEIMWYNKNDNSYLFNQAFKQELRGSLTNSSTIQAYKYIFIGDILTFAIKTMRSESDSHHISPFYYQTSRFLYHL